MTRREMSWIPGFRNGYAILWNLECWKITFFFSFLIYFFNFALLWIQDLHFILDVVDFRFILDDQMMARRYQIADVYITQWGRGEDNKLEF